MALLSVSFGIQAMVSSLDIAYAARMYIFVYSVGMSVGVALGGNIFQNVMLYSLQNRGLLDDIAKHAQAFIEALQRMNKHDPHYEKVVDAYVEGFWVVFLAMAIASAITRVVSFIIKNYELRSSVQGSHKQITKPESITQR